jgi:hypothetical protein
MRLADGTWCKLNRTNSTNQEHRHMLGLLVYGEGTKVLEQYRQPERNRCRAPFPLRCTNPARIQE